MKYLAAYLLAGIGGKTDPSVSDLESILGSVGADFQKQNAETIVKILNGKPIDEVISAGLSKLASVPSGAAPTAAAPAAGGGKPAAAPAEDKKKKEEVKEESEDDDMGFGLFD